MAGSRFYAASWNLRCVQEEDGGDVEMDECLGLLGNSTSRSTSTSTSTATTAVAIMNEDPDSRDSGVSMGSCDGRAGIVSLKTAATTLETTTLTEAQCSSSSNSNSLATAMDSVLDISGGGRKVPFHRPPLYHTASSINLELEDFIEENTAVDQDAFQQQQEAAITSSPMKKRQRRFSNGQQGPTDFSFLHQSQSALNTSSTLLDHSDRDIPPAARSIHRVHSASVLERSWGSPDTFEHYSLRTMDRPQVSHRAFRSINAETMVDLLESMNEEQFKKRFILIDCRYPYEFEGGHIWYSENVFNTDSIIKLFYPEEEKQFEDISQRIPIFYCEYSQKRGPQMALALREYDRNRNESRYPYVDYKEIYLLDRGYRHFFRERQFTKFCHPQAYVQMWDPTYAAERKEHDGHRRVKKRRRN